MTKARTDRPSWQPELPTFFGHKPDEVVVDLSGQPYRSTLHAFTPGDDEVYLLVRCKVGKSTLSPPGDEGGRVMRQALHAVVGYPIDPAYGAERLEQLSIANEHREDAAKREAGKATAGKLDLREGLNDLADADTPHEFYEGPNTDVCALPECGRAPGDPLHHVDDYVEGDGDPADADEPDKEAE